MNFNGIILFLVLIKTNIFCISDYKYQNISNYSTKSFNDSSILLNNTFTNTNSSSFNQLKINSTNTLECMKDYECIEEHICDLNLNKCVHRGIWPIRPKNLITFLLIAITCSTATSIGVGGGAIICTLLMSIEYFSHNQAIPLSTLIILCCSITTFFIGATNQVEYDSHNFIDYDLVLVACPLVLFGAKIGTLLNIILPNSIVFFILMIIITLASIKSYNRAKSYSHKENIDILNSKLIEFKNENFEIGFTNKKSESFLILDETNKNNNDSNIFNSCKELKVVNIKEISSNSNTKSDKNKRNSKINLKDDFNLFNELEKRKSRISSSYITKLKENTKNESIISEEKKEVNTSGEDFELIKEEEDLKLLVEKIREIELIKSDMFYENNPIRLNRIRTLMELTSILIILEIILGNKNFPSVIGIETCSTEYFTILILFGIASYITSYLCLENVKKEIEMSEIFESVMVNKEELNKKEEYFNIANASAQQLFKLKFYCFLAGVIASTCGVGGGILISPTLIEIGINPRIAASSSNLIVIISTFSATLLNLFLKRILFDFGFLYSIIAVASSLIGNSFISEYIKQTNKTSIIIYFLFYMLIFSLILLPINAFIMIGREYEIYGEIFRFKTLC